MKAYSELKERLIRLAKGRYGIAILGAVSFVESIFFPITPLMLLIPLCALNRHKWALYAATVVIFGEMGCCVTYFLGYYLWEQYIFDLIVAYDLSEQLGSITELYGQYGMVVPFIGAFLPITYNMTAAFCGMISANADLAAGNAAGVSFFMFLGFSFVGKFLRFFIETWLIVGALGGAIKLLPVMKAVKRKLHTK